MLPLAGGLFLGWTIGANDASNVFGTAVASRIVPFRQAAVLCGTALIVGALLQGQAGIHTLSGLTPQNTVTLLAISLGAAGTVLLMIFLKLPVSATHAVVGAITGIGLVTGSMNWTGLEKIVICWLTTPLAALVTACVLYRLLGWLIMKVPMSMLTRDKILWGGLLVLGMYGSYALGANNVANTVGIFSNQYGGMNDQFLALIGGVAIAVGVLTYGKRMMYALGSGVMVLDAFTAFVSVFAMAVTVHTFAWIGVPVSARQAIVGAILGVGLMRGMHTLHYRALKKIAVAWILTPAVSLILSAAGYGIFSPK